MLEVLKYSDNNYTMWSNLLKNVVVPICIIFILLASQETFFAIWTMEKYVFKVEMWNLLFYITLLSKGKPLQRIFHLYINGVTKCYNQGGWNWKKKNISKI